MIDLCIDARMAFSSGIGTCIRELVPFFNHPPFRLILLVSQKDADWCKGIEQIVFSAPIYSIREQVQFPSVVKNYDLFWSPHYNIPILPIRAKKRVVTIHDVCHLVYGSFLQKAYAKFVIRGALKSDAIVTDSHFSKSEIARFFGSSKEIHVIANGVNQDRFKRVNVIDLKKKYQLPERFVLYVGNLKTHKNLAGLLEGFKECSSPDLSLVIAGKGEEQISGQRILPLGRVSDADLPGLYNMAEAFIFPSFYEGFGLPPLEAMSCGCPTIVANSSSLPEVCGDASYYVNPRSPEEISKAIQNVTGNMQLRQRLIENGLNRVKMFKWADTALKYRKLFEEIHYA